MRELPILFSGPLVRAILDGRKTQTRRIVRIDDRPVSHESDVDLGRRRGTARGIPSSAQNVRMCGCYLKCDAPPGSTTVSSRVFCPYGAPGDLLYVREAWRSPADWDHEPPRNLRPYEPILYLADAEKQESKVGHRDLGWGRYRHARFMPKALARLWLRVTEVRVERVQDITQAEARAEGVCGGFCPEDMQDDRDLFRDLWDRINGKRAPWESNPWVWVVSFERTEAPCE